MKERAASVGRGIFLVALGRPEGIGCFRGTARAFFASLVPMLGFAVAAAALLLANGERHQALVALLSTSAAVLAGPVASHFIAVRLGREVNWARYATASNWFVCLIFLLCEVVIALWASGMVGLAAGGVLTLAALVYALWVQVCLTRHALALDWLRAALVVSVVAAANFVFVLVPAVLVALMSRPGG
jgi:hypothetical protein